MGNALSLKNEASENGEEGKHSLRRAIPQGDKGQRLGQGANPTPK
jgi:hypothetical protein